MNIVILEPLGIEQSYLNELSLHLTKLGHTIKSYNSKPQNEEESIARSKDADILIVANHPLSGNVLNSCKNLKMISVAFTGVDHIDIDTCKQKGIRVSNSAGYSTHAVAELTFGLILSVYRYIVSCDLITREGGIRGNYIGNEIYGKTLGIIGTGAIGLKVAEIGKAFGCKIIAYNRTIKEEGNKLGIKYLDIKEVISKSDILTIHVPLTEDTKNLIDEGKINLMKNSSIIINTARGPIIDNKALSKALCEGKIAGAGIDVFETEPPLPIEHPLLNAPNTVVAPHIGFATKEALNRRAKITFDNIHHFLKGESINTII